MKVVRLSALCTSRLYPPGNITGTHFSWRMIQPQEHTAVGKIMSMKNSIGSRTRDFLPSSAVPQPTVPPRDPFSLVLHILPYRHFLVIFVRMLAVIELVNGKHFGLVDAASRLLGCNTTAGTEGGTLDGRCLYNSWDLSFGSLSVMISMFEVDVVHVSVFMCVS
jgi:hypothetical protein